MSRRSRDGRLRFFIISRPPKGDPSPAFVLAECQDYESALELAARAADVRVLPYGLMVQDVKLQRVLTAWDKGESVARPSHARGNLPQSVVRLPPSEDLPSGRVTHDADEELRGHA